MSKTDLQKTSNDVADLFGAHYKEAKEKAVAASFTWRGMTINMMVAPEAIGSAALMNRTQEIAVLGMIAEETIISWDLTWNGEPFNPTLDDFIKYNAPVEFVSVAVEAAFSVVAGKRKKSNS